MATYTVTKMCLDDVGKRALHYADVLELWAETIEYLKTKKSLTAQNKIEELEMATILLRNTMANMTVEYNEKYYVKEINIIARNQAKEDAAIA